MVYWKGEKYWVGKLLEYPEIMTQGETITELEENIKDAFLLMTMEDVPADRGTFALKYSPQKSYRGLMYIAKTRKGQKKRPRIIALPQLHRTTDFIVTYQG